MKSAFGSKRKPRIIQADEDDDDVKDSNGGEMGQDTSTSVPNSPASVKGGRKSFKKSSLRKSIVFNDDASLDLPKNEAEGSGDIVMKDAPGIDTEELPIPVVKPSISRSTSTKKKSRLSSRLSFGPGELISGDDAAALEESEVFTPKKPTLGRRVIESNAVRKSLPGRIPMPAPYDDDERPTYSKDYLAELRNSTPSTPIQSISASVAEDEQILDASELEGATIVDDVASIFGSTALVNASDAHIPTEAEIREKKERRARLAREKDFISLDARNSGDENFERQSYVSLLPRKKEKETRLVREDEDLGEGFDEFVDDGRIALGKKAEKEARRKQRAEIASLIHDAEGPDDEEEEDDSEAERIAAYEAAQTRAGMDGLKKSIGGGDRGDSSGEPQVPSKITPLPNFGDTLKRFMDTVKGMERQLEQSKQVMEGLENEKREIGERQEEVQRLVKEAGERFAALSGVDANVPTGDPAMMNTAPPMVEPFVANRGLESFGTPVRRGKMEDVG